MLSGNLNKYQNKENKLSRMGFTLIELVVVIIIIGILVSIGVPQYNQVVEDSRKAEAYATLKSILGAQIRYASTNDAYTSDPNNLDINYSSMGKYFSFVLLPKPVDALDGNTNGTIAQATRLPSNSYCIFITESGYFYEGQGGDCTIIPW